MPEPTPAADVPLTESELALLDRFAAWSYALTDGNRAVCRRAAAELRRLRAEAEAAAELLRCCPPGGDQGCGCRAAPLAELARWARNNIAFWRGLAQSPPSTDQN